MMWPKCGVTSRIDLREARATLVVGLLLVLLSGSVQAQTLTVLHSFTGKADGAYPYGGVIMDQDGNLYGATSTGGRYKNGTIYKIDPSGKTSVLHQFTHHEGAGSSGSLFRDKGGNLYGTNFWAGNGNYGTVFELRASGKFIVLHTFGHDGGFDGLHPYAGLIRDGAGNLYGTASNGGMWGQGAVFRVDHRTGAETVLYSFGLQPDGSFPTGGLRIDSEGNLYGTTGSGGTLGSGTVFKLDPSGTEEVLYNFGESSAWDGEDPTADLLPDIYGNFYGTAAKVGKFGFGTVFKLDSSGVETVLHDFDGNGATPFAGLTWDSAGNLYGTTLSGGDLGAGVVFKMEPSGGFTVLHSFSGQDGAAPWAGVILDQGGNVYGTTPFGGTYGYGVVYKLTP